MADTHEYLDELKAKRRTRAGVRSAQVGDQRTDYDLEALDREIARVERALASPTTRTRYAVVSKGA